jgi:hypothetical protein
MQPFSLLICTLRSHCEGGRNVVLQTRIVFWLEIQKKNPSLKNHFSATLKITSKGADEKAACRLMSKLPTSQLYLRANLNLF